MKAGRKNLRRAASKDDGLDLEEGHSIMQVVSLRGSNVIEVMDAKGMTTLAMFPAKFQKSFWIKRGNFVVVDESGRDKALESGSKIGCTVSQVLYHDQVRKLEKSSEWPALFMNKELDDNLQQAKLGPEPEPEEMAPSDDEETSLPPLEANLNRIRPVELYSRSDSDTDCSS